MLALGGYDITHHLIMYFLKPIEQGLDVKFTGGIHTRLPAGAGAGEERDPDGEGSARETDRRARAWARRRSSLPIACSARMGSTPTKDVEWRVFPAGELGLALDKGEVDAIADSEPIGTLLLAEGKVRNIADQAKDAPYKDEYCCAVIVNGKYPGQAIQRPPPPRRARCSRPPNGWRPIPRPPRGFPWRKNISLRIPS